MGSCIMVGDTTLDINPSIAI